MGYMSEGCPSNFSHATKLPVMSNGFQICQTVAAEAESRPRRS
jgi:hypothetical protein